MCKKVKKWMSGFLSCLALLVLTAGVPSRAVYGVLFPSTVTIHDGNGSRTIDGTGEDGILNYNDKAYVPLRTFAENMGATVEYVPPSDETGVHKIDIIQGAAPIQWTLEPTETVFPKSQDICRPNHFPFYIMPSQTRNADSTTDTYHFTFRVHNLMPDDITVEPIELTFEVKDESGQVVYSRPLPPLSGVIPSNFGFSAAASWDHTGSDGEEVPPGTYYISLKRPAEVTFKVLGSDEEKNVLIVKGMGCNVEAFQIII
ncbi:hypothetical protein [Paenibacillus flagellatus]|uniref:Copper amine oxidase-like N-terminal domain-containing protein n=1 Tax=Paenibacillus flagellatus TaxID=2211139 RepID=A0A2V5L3H0_9BACL|nr:hypothetical protein [Paenibacillus flagellatus]PYI57376.1 hypothetical protein DLM86_02755 [Paenibacillus flagellatus]